MFDPNDVLALKNYCQKIIENPRPIDMQPHKREGRFLWCGDWRIIELLKYFFNGHDLYMGDPPPNRLKGNPLWSKEAIVDEAQALLKTHKTATNIIQYFIEERARPYGYSA